LKSDAIVNVEFLDEISRVEWSCLCVLSNDAPASDSEPDPNTDVELDEEEDD
jgi:hypothetical protein